MGIRLARQEIEGMAITGGASGVPVRDGHRAHERGRSTTMAIVGAR